MTFALHVDAPRWRAHTSGTRDAIRSVVRRGEPGSRLGEVVPVAKGNGYGFGIDRLAAEAQRLGTDVMAVGTPYEVAAAAARFTGDILVLQPWDPRDATAAQAWNTVAEAGLAQRLIRTVADVEALHSLVVDVSGLATTAPRVLIEGLTSMRRFGLAEPDLDAVMADPVVRTAVRQGRIVLSGLALHLPLSQPLAPHVQTLEREWHDVDAVPMLPKKASGRAREAWSWALTWIRSLAALEDAGCAVPAQAASLWVSHLDDTELGQLRRAVPDVPIMLRTGTRLWLGEEAATTARGTVLAVHDVTKGRAVGYRQRRAPHDGLLVVVGGGTSHGVALAAPSPAGTARQRMVAAATGVLEATGRSKSPFEWAGKSRWFAEPPHAQLSLIWLTADDVRQAMSAGHKPPGVGDEWACRIRHTTASFDRIVGLG